MQTLSRRTFIAASGTAALSVGSLAKGARAVGRGEPFLLARVHEQAAALARQLTNGRAISLAILIPKGCAANILPVTQAFTEATGIGFRLVETPVDDINSTIIIDSLSQANTFDLALPATFGIPDLVEAGALLDLQDLAKIYQPEDFQQGSLFSLGDYYEDRLYGYQTDGDTYLMFYNRDWLEDVEAQKRFADKFGYELTIPETWEQLDAMMKFFHRPGEDRFGGALFRNPTYIAWEFWIRPKQMS